MRAACGRVCVCLAHHLPAALQHVLLEEQRQTVGKTGHRIAKHGETERGARRRKKITSKVATKKPKTDNDQHQAVSKLLLFFCVPTQENRHTRRLPNYFFSDRIAPRRLMAHASPKLTEPAPRRIDWAPSTCGTQRAKRRKGKRTTHTSTHKWRSKSARGHRTHTRRARSGRSVARECCDEKKKN